MANGYYQGLLDAVNAAIASAQSYGEEASADGKSSRTGRLADMYAERKRLEPLAAREAAGSGGIRVRLATPTG